MVIYIGWSLNYFEEYISTRVQSHNSENLLWSLPDHVVAAQAFIASIINVATAREKKSFNNVRIVYCRRNGTCKTYDFRRPKHGLYISLSYN